MNFYCIADEDTVRGFRLAGVQGEPVTGPEQAITAIAAAVERPDCGIVIVTQQIASSIRPQLNVIRAGRPHPLIVEIPGPTGPHAGQKSLTQLVQEAVGIHVEQEVR